MTAVGCTGAKVDMKPIDNMGATNKADQDKIKEHLDAAGIKGEIYTIGDNGTQWIVDVGAPKPPPGKRAAPTIPTTYLIDKATGKVTNTESK